MIKRFAKFKIILVLFFVLLISLSCFAEEQESAETDNWQAYIAPFLWIADIESTFSTPNVTFLDKRLNFKEIIENLKGVFATEYGFEKGKFSIDGGLLYMFLKMDLEPRILPGDRTTKLKIFFSQLLLGYDLFELPVGDTMKLKYEQQMGARYYRMRTIVDKLAGGELSDTTLAWTDFVVGGEFTLDVNDKVSLVARGNAGGFDWGSSSKLAWAVGGFVDYHLTERSTVRVGYSHLDIEKEQGPVTLDTSISGPVVEYIFRF